ncbi:FtsX-like permease family protein [Paenibacillus sp. FSL P4-0338]|uniref:FtsX-like permease family protein n=1 Tax=Paenibacillus sp. FSL P4-0338 TaxID=2921635 RepID=UPI0030FA89BD
MYAVWKLCWTNLKHKKVQNSFIAIIIMLAALLLSTAVSVLNNTNRMYGSMHDQSRGAHQILQMENGIHDPVEVHKWWEEQSGVTASDLMRYRYLSSMSHAGKEIPNVDLFMMDAPEGPFPVDRLQFVEGEEQSTPEAGTAWIPTSLAYSNDIHVGDSVEFKTDEGTIRLNVAAVVVDISYCSPFATSGRIWLNHEDYNTHMTLLPGGDKYMTGLRFEDYSQHRTYWDRFEQSLGTPYLESVKDFESLSSYYMIANQVISFMMIFLAVVMICVALYTLGFTIADAVLSNYRTIGIIKSVGLSSRKVIMAYVAQYTFLALVSVIPGMLVSNILSGTIVAGSMAYLNTGSSGMNDLLSVTGVGTSIAVVAIIFLSTLLFANKARHVEPAQAVRYGMSEKEYSHQSRGNGTWKRKLLQLGTLPTSMIIGLRSVTKNIRGSLLIVLISALSTAVLVFGFLFVYSIASIHGTIAKWGYDSADLSIRIDNPAKMTFAQLQEEVLSDPRVKNYSRYGDANAVVPIPPKDGSAVKQDTMGILLTVADGNYDEIGYENVDGHNPVSANEISVGVNVARTLGIQAGDSLDIYIEGEEHTLTVTGIYQAIANMSNSGRITADVIRTSNPDYGSEMSTTFINLNEGTSTDSFVNELQERYGSVLGIASQASLVDEVFSQAVKIIVLPVSVMALLFIVITFVIIYSICRINMKKESRTYGIYKSIGMTSRQIRLSETTGILVVSGIGALVGIPVGLLGLPPLLNVILSDYGIIQVPLIMNGGGITAMIPLSVIAAGLGCWAASKSIRSASPRVLVVD